MFQSHNMSTKTVITLLLVTMMLLMACSFPAVTIQLASTATPTPTDTPVPTNTPAPSPTPKSALPQVTNPGQGGTPSCYLGSWQLKDISGLMKSVLTTQNVQDIQFTGSTGSFTLLFTKDNKISFKADQFHNMLSAKISILPVTLDVAVDGSGGGNYSLDSSGSLLLSNPDFDALTVTATAAGIQLLPPTKLKDLIPSLNQNFNGEAIATGSTCSGNTLSFDTGIANAPPLSFTRTGQ